MPYQRANLYDETVQLLITPDGTQPVMVSDSDSGTFTGLDERYPIIGYHRITGVDEEILPGYGDSDNEVRETISMLMVVYNNRKQTKIKASDLARYVKAGFRSSLTASEINTTGISQVLIETGSTNLNTSEVLSAEYSNISDISPVWDAFSVSYDILLRIDKSCLALC